MIILTGGKTGGHIIPLIAISKKLKDDYIYVGGKDYLEEKICQKNDINFIGLEIKNNILKLIKAYFELKRKIKKEIKCVISTGGFVSVPVLIYAILYRIPFYLLEENLVMGNTNKIFSFFSKKVFLSYPLSSKNIKHIVVGQPLLIPKLSYSKYSNYKMQILIIGGSLGSKPLCDLALKLNETYSVGLVAGRYYDEYKNKCKYTFEYVEDLMNLMLQADLIISRAGAQTTAEIFSLEKLCILIPSLKTKKNHQVINANYFEKKGCCKVIDEKKIFECEEVIKELLNNKIIFNSMRKCQREVININSINLIINEIGKKYGKL